jgi:toxin ParE1/3/4
MRKLLVAPRAQRDIDAALNDSAERHGRSAARRYRRLITLAIQALHERPERPAARRIGAGDLRLYALRTAVRQLDLREPVRAPSHLVVFRFDEGLVEIVRLLHEAMDLPRHLGLADEGDGDD